MKKSWLNKILIAAAIVATIIVTYAVIFMVSMTYFEARAVTFPQSLQVVVESLTTSGYGGFAPWESSFLNYFVLFMNLTGVALVFIAFPVFFLPYLKDAVWKTIPVKVTKTGHVIICGHTTYTDVLINELDSRDQDYIIIEQDETLAMELMSSGFNVMIGDAELNEVLEAACIADAKAVVVNTDIFKSISIIFTVRNILKSTEVIAVVTDKHMTEYYKLAGADVTITPRQLIGESLAGQVAAVSISNSVEIDNTIELLEIGIEEGSELCNRTIVEANLLDQYHVNTIGAWVNGKFQSPVSLNLKLNSKTRLLIAGDHDELEKITKKAEAKTRQFIRNKVLIFGYGQSGQAAAEFLKSKSVEVNIIDIEEKEGVDYVGDVRNSDTLEKMGIDRVSAIIITIQDDTTAIFSTLMARNLNPDAQIIVRANKDHDIDKLYQAGADYVQSLSKVSGRMLASCIFDDETSLAAEKQINLVQLPAGLLAGKTLSENDVRSATGCTILAVIRNGEKITALDPNEFVFQNKDEVIVAGTDDSIHKFEKKYLTDNK